MAEQDGDISPHVRIRIDPERKREWLEYADENDLSLTDLIKTAVDNTISDTWVLESDVERSDMGEVDVDLDGVDDGIDEVLERLTAIESQLDGVTLQDTGDIETPDRNELIQLANRCHNHLPKVRDGDHLREISSRIVTPDGTEVPQLTGTAEDIARELGEDQERVRQALIFLEQEQHANISSVIQEGIRRWYEVDPSVGLDDPLEDARGEYSVEFETASEFEERGR